MRILLLAMLLSLSSFATDLDKVYEVVKHVESNHRETVVGDGGRAYGIVQIHKICVKDINRIYGTSYTHQQAFNAKVAKEMFMLYIKAGIKLFRGKFHRSPTEEEIVRMWNGGIYSGYCRESTVDYYNKYKYYKSKLKL